MTRGNFQHLLCLCVSLQGVEESADGLKLISDVIVDKLGITMSVLMGANIANEVADEKFCETTIGSLLCVVTPFIFFFCTRPSGLPGDQLCCLNSGLEG